MLTRFVTWTRENPVYGDAALVVVLLLAGWVLGGQSGATVLPFVPLVLRRTSPVAMFAGVAVVLAGQVVVTDRPMIGDVALLIALYAVAAYGPTWAAWVGLATGLLGAVLATGDWFRDGNDLTGIVTSWVFLSTLVGASWLLGMLQRVRGAYVAGLEERAVRLEREAAQQAEIAAAAERARIAREMHDVVAHSLSVMIVQADGALYASATDPAAAPRALSTISETGRSSLTEMRSLLGLLRSDDVEAGPELTPLPSARDLPVLVEQVRASGLDVTLQVDGVLAAVPDGPGLTTYRVVQEALTNTLKHAGPGVRVTVVVTVALDAVRVRVDDDGRGVTALDDGAGHGLRGVRERIAVHTGRVDAGPRPGGGFRVAAVIPLQEVAAP